MMVDQAHDVTGEIARLSMDLVRQATALAAGLADAVGLAPTDVRALRALDVIGAEPAVTVGAVAQRLALSSAATTGLVDRLERAGLAERYPDPADRRRVLVRLTPRARAFGTEHLRPLHERISAAVAGLPPEQAGAVRDFLARVVDVGVDAGEPRQ